LSDRKEFQEEGVSEKEFQDTHLFSAEEFQDSREFQEGSFRGSFRTPIFCQYKQIVVGDAG